MDELLTGLDGITFQHVGELLLQCGTTENERKRCRVTYFDCFEQVAFAVLMSDRIALNADLPRVGTDTPGENLKAFLGEMVVPVRDTAPRDWRAKLLDLPEFSSKTTHWLSLLDKAILQSRTAWDHWIIREVSADYLGTDAEIGPSTTPLTAVQFKAEHYLGHHPAQEAIPQKFVSDLAETLRRNFPKLQVEPSKVREFIERSALTHVVNYWKMNLDVADNQLNNLVRLPHATRASIRLIENTADARDNSRMKLGQADRKRNEVLRCLMPFPIRHLMEDIRHREKIVQRLLDLRDFQPIPQVRDRLRKVFGELEQGNTKPATKLCNEINELALTKDSNDWPGSTFTIGWNLDHNVPYVSASTKFLSKLFETDHYFLKQFTAPEPKHAISRVSMLFPELGRKT